MIKVMEEDWDYLLILDACRYDYFEEVYQDYLSGDLERVISPGSHTSEWCEKTFESTYENIVYVSATPHINSKGSILGGFDATKHFAKVVDVWDWGWDEKLRTVPPKEVNEAILESSENFPDKRIIAHYIQPHTPYLSLGWLGATGTQQGRNTVKAGVSSNSSKLKRMRGFVGSNLKKFFGQEVVWELRGFLGLQPAEPMEAIVRKFGKKRLREAYEENLRIVLSHVESLIRDISGKIVVTSDHGERLGENGKYFHEPGSKDPLLLEVPWFEIR